MKYLVRVTGLVEIEAPNAAAALKFARYGKVLSDHKAVRISAGMSTALDHRPGRNIHLRDYRLSAYAKPTTTTFELVKEST